MENYSLCLLTYDKEKKELHMATALLYGDSYYQRKEGALIAIHYGYYYVYY